MNVPPRPEPELRDQEPLQAVLEWLDRHVERFSLCDSDGADNLVTGMLDELRRAAERDELELAWSSLGLERDDVGPVIVLLSSRGAVLASVARPRTGRSLLRGA